MLLISAAVVAFLVISALLARWLQTENVERDNILGLLRAQAAGDARGMLRSLPACARQPACVATVQTEAQRLRRPGSVKIPLLQSHTAFSLGSSTGATRVAWTVIGRLPVVQCVLVHRRGNAVTGLSVSLLRLSAPIPGTGTC